MTGTAVEQPKLEELRTKRRKLFDRRDELNSRNRRGLSGPESEELLRTRDEITRLDEEIKLEGTPPAPASPCPLHEPGIDGMLARAQKLGDKLALVASHFKTEPTLVIAHMRDACAAWYDERAEEDAAADLLRAQLVELREQLPGDTLKGQFSQTKSRIAEVELELEQSNLVRQAKENEACLEWDRDVAIKRSERECKRRVLELDARRRHLVHEITAASRKVESWRTELEAVEREIPKLEKTDAR